MFETTLYARRGDMDFNGPMRNTAHRDKPGGCRAARKPVVPPPDQVEARDAMGRTDDFQAPPSRT